MRIAASTRLTAVVAAVGIVAAGAIFAAPASASEREPVTPIDTRSVQASAEDVTHEGGTRGELTGGGDFQATATGAITGTYLIDTGSGVEPANGLASFICILQLDPVDQLFWYHQDGCITDFEADGSFSFTLPEAGTYRLEFVSYQYDVDMSNNGFWDGTGLDGFWFNSVDIVLTDGGAGLDVGELTLGQREIDSYRIAGVDRFATAVEISKVAYPDENIPVDGVPVVYVVNGLGFADALSAGPAAAANGGVILSVRSTSIPEVVAAELTRLNPQRIVVVGGTGVISAGVATQLRTYSDDVDRIGGADRYETSRLIVDDAFGTLDELFIATGTAFADALAAGPAASRLGGAVLLVYGAAGTIDTPTKNLITALGSPDSIRIAGGTGAVSAGVAASILSNFPGATLTRYPGTDRFDTANSINIDVFGDYGADRALIAAGLDFPDALAGGPLAAIVDSPIYLARPACIPGGSFNGIVDIFAKEVWVLGGTGVLTNQVMNGTVCE